MKNLIDLHVHSYYSDGELSPDELISIAFKKGIRTISITDHDTIKAYKNISNYDYVKIIPGIELSTNYNQGQMHILGYGIDINNLALNQKIKEIENNNFYSVMTMIVQLKKDYGIVFALDDLREMFLANHNLGRPDIARLLVKGCYVSSIDEAFDKYLKGIYSKIGRLRKGLNYEECIKLILNAGGIPVLAHPCTIKLNYDQLIELVGELVSIGLQGIEVYHSDHSIEQISDYMSIADEYSLLVSGGSDYHGPFIKPGIELGSGKENNLKIKKLSILDKLEE